MEAVLYVTADVVRMIAIMAQPVMPAAMGKMLDMLGVPGEYRDFAHIGTALVPGTALPVPAPIFPRYVEAEAAS